MVCVYISGQRPLPGRVIARQGRRKMALSLLGLSLLSVGIFSVVPCDTLSPVLPTVVSAVGKIVQHYKSNFHELNLDGLFGLRVVEGMFPMF